MVKGEAKKIQLIHKDTVAPPKLPVVQTVDLITFKRKNQKDMLIQ